MPFQVDQQLFQTALFSANNEACFDENDFSPVMGPSNASVIAASENEPHHHESRSKKRLDPLLHREKMGMPLLKKEKTNKL